jgi:hypothetical protein
LIGNRLIISREMAYTRAMNRIALAVLIALALGGCKSNKEGTPSDPASKPAAGEPTAQPAPAPGAEPEAAEPDEDPAAEAEADDEDAMLDAAGVHIRKSAGAAAPLSLSVAEREGDYARVRAQVMQEGSKPEALYMKRESGAWTVVAQGSDVSCDKLAAAGVPSSVIKDCK